MQEVILVDEYDKEIGRMEKLRAHQEGVLHRAFSIFIFNREGKLLLQRRALNKYHSGGLWTNTCCSHPAPGEDLLSAAKHRLLNEMGFETDLRFLFSFTYKAAFPNGLIEHELDHVFVGEYNGDFQLNPEEAMDYKWLSYHEVNKSVKDSAQDYTAWFLKIYDPVLKNHSVY